MILNSQVPQMDFNIIHNIQNTRMVLTTPGARAYVISLAPTDWCSQESGARRLLSGARAPLVFRDYDSPTKYIMPDVYQFCNTMAYLRRICIYVRYSQRRIAVGCQRKSRTRCTTRTGRVVRGPAGVVLLCSALACGRLYCGRMQSMEEVIKIRLDFHWLSSSAYDVIT